MGDDFDDEASGELLRAFALQVQGLESEAAESMRRAQAMLREATQLLNEEELPRLQEELSRLQEELPRLQEEYSNRLREQLERARQERIQEQFAELEARRRQQDRTNDIFSEQLELVMQRAYEKLAEVLARFEQQDRTNDIGGNGEPIVVSPRIAGTRSMPECTDSARLNRIDETLVFDAVVRRDGSVEVQGIVNDGNIPQDMVDAAASTVLQWDFEPGTLNGRPVDVSLNIEVNIDCG